ncbi:uncharacterized protein TNCV_1940621 [Trichonephila clavipes]|nr:uncharacterized protein TNCV_1940621 [Trichonephila clavipes]
MRGRILQPEHCIQYYRNQIGNGDPYFSSDFPIQRGYGFFSNLRRYALPLMIQAGKYLGGAAIEEREERRRKEDESEQEGVDKMGERENMLE